MFGSRQFAILTAALFLSPGSGWAQVAPPPFAIHNDSRERNPVATLGFVPDSARRYPPTHWKRGLLVGAALGAAFGAYLGYGLCHDSDTRHGSCIPSAVGGAVVLALPTSVIGGLIGSLFPKRPA
jgi:hypothetical protein